MALTFSGIEWDCLDPERLCRFWGELLGRTREGPTLPGTATRFWISFVPTLAAKTNQNRIHFDLTSTSFDDQRSMVARARRLGAVPADVGQGPDASHVVLADPEGNEFCVIEPGNNFLANTGLIGAVNCDGTRTLGQFWSAALEWPLVWDQDEETAIQSPNGGSKLTWSGPPLMPRSGRDRLRLVVSSKSAEAATDAQRLVSLGATTERGRENGRQTLTDPDGNEVVMTVS